MKKRVSIYLSIYLSFFLSFSFLTACSTNINDGSSSDRSLTINVKQKGSSDARALSNTPYTAEVKITEKNTLIAKKSKDIAEGGATFEFKGLPLDATVDVTLTIYVGQTIITSGTNSCTIEPNKDNRVDIELDFTKKITTATLSASEADKISGIMRFANSGGVTVSFTEKPDFSYINYVCEQYPSAILTIDLTPIGATDISFTELDPITALLKSNPGVGLTIKVAKDSCISVSGLSYEGLKALKSTDSVKVKLETATERQYTSILNTLNLSSLQNVTLDYTSFGNTVYSYTGTNSNVVAVNISNITTIKQYAFYYFTALSNASLQKYVQCVEGYSFNNNTNLYVPANKTTGKVDRFQWSAESGGNIGEGEVKGYIVGGTTCNRNCY